MRQPREGASHGSQKRVRFFPFSALAHRAEKWTRFSASNDALFKERSIGWDPKSEPTFGSDALRAVFVALDVKAIDRVSRFILYGE
jgi:hypothetical protein